METVAIVMMVLMMAGFFGFGLHDKMMGGHDKKDQKEESEMHNHDKKPSVTVPVELEKKEEVIR
ncbi:MAG: hypothetical protein HY279_00780 [Nitrospinae bacterium]|nr:hypothetical protein [Nitrospinota bacterium]